MSRILRIATTEYLNAVRSKAFLIGIIMMPILMGGGLIANVIAEESQDLRDREVAVLDHTGRLYDVLASESARRNEELIWEIDPDSVDATDAAEPRREQVASRFLLERYEHDPDEARSPELVLSERVREDELYAFVVIGEDAFDVKRSTDDAIAYYSDSPTYGALPRWIEREVQDAVEATRFATADVDADLIADLTKPVRFNSLSLVEASATGEETGGEEQNDIRNKAVPIASMFLLFMMLMMSAPQALNVVLEEKMQKISEVLISAVTPFQLMMGKILGTVLVSLTLSVLYLGAISITSVYYEFDNLIPTSLYVWFVFFQVLALLTYTAIFAAIGAACSEMRDAQSLMTPAMLLFVMPMFFFAVVLESPDSPMAVATSLFPPATPMLMMLRVAIPPGPPVWELVLAIVLTLAFTCACVWAAGKVFRIGLLATGQAPTVRKLVGWVLSK